MDGLSLTIGGAALTTIGGIAGAWIKAWSARNQRTEITPDPIHTEQSTNQALWKSNDKDHTDIFARLRKVEADVSGLKSDVRAVNTNLDRMYNMIAALYDKIIGGKK